MRAPGRRQDDLVVTSLQNERVKAIRALDMGKSRRETGLFVAEGASVLIAAREQGRVPQTLVMEATAARTGAVAELLAWARSEGSEILPVTRPVLEKLAHKDNPQTLMGVFRQRWAELPEPRAIGREATWLALEEVRDPGNLGTIIRTAHATGVSGIILAGNCCDPFSREAVRATMGSVFAVPLARVEPEAFRSWTAAWPGDRVGMALAGSEDFRAIRYRAPVLLVMGSEGPGLSEATARLCTRLVRIPMAPGIDSLNLAVATALALYAIRGERLSV